MASFHLPSGANVSSPVRAIYETPVKWYSIGCGCRFAEGIDIAQAEVCLYKRIRISAIISEMILYDIVFLSPQRRKKELSA